MNNGALSLHLGLCGALGDGEPRYLPCAQRMDPALTDEPEVVVADAGSEATPVQSGSRGALYDPSMQERKDEIDALRARVDVILNKMVQSSGDDVQRLRQKIAEMRAGPAQAAAVAVAKPALPMMPWNAADPKQCPLSPMTTNTTATNATQNTSNSATPSADTEPHANLSTKRQPPAQESLLNKIEDAEQEDDDDIDDMEFDFKVAALSMSKSVQIAEIDGSIGGQSGSKKAKDPPAALKKCESMLPDPGGDASYCSNSSRCDSPPPGSLLYEAAARKADSVVGREREQKAQADHDQLQKDIEKTKEMLQQREQKMKSPPATQDILAETQSPKASSSFPGPDSKSPVASRTAQSIPAKSTKKAQPKPLEIIDADEDPEVLDEPHMLQRSRSPPPPVANVNIPNIMKSSNPSSGASVGSHASDSSLTRPPSPSPANEITMVEEVTEQRIRDPYGDKGLYTGVLVKRRPHGRGTMKYDDGRHYEGHWNHGRWHGVGRAIFANNDIFEGTYDMDQRHGHGMYQWNDGRVYTGQFFQDQRQGRGTYTWPDGAVYQGEFKAGHRHGQGMYRFADGSVYTGEWENGKYHGVGECRWSDGRSYRGEWKEGRANGYGVETRPNGTIRHDGEWKDDRPIRDSKRNTQGEAVAK